MNTTELTNSIRESVKDYHDFGFTAKELAAANEAVLHIVHNLEAALKLPKLAEAVGLNDTYGKEAV